MGTKSGYSRFQKPISTSGTTTRSDWHAIQRWLVYVEVYCTDLKLYGSFNKAYGSFFHKPYPARDFIGVKDLLFGAHFEVMGIAVRNAAQNKKQPVSGQ